MSHQTREKKSALLLAAIEYAQAGFPVFPCRPGTKFPIWKGGYASGTTDLDLIEKTWAEADYNIGFNPETAPGGPWFVADVDNKAEKYGSRQWAALCDENGGHIRTWTVQTSTGGLHYYYRGSLRDSVGRINPTTGRTAGLGPGLDTRGQRGLVLLPPSLGANGQPYIVVDDAAVANGPAWIAERLGERNDSGWDAPDDVILDDPASVEWFREILAEDVELNGSPQEGDGSDTRAYNLVGVARDGDRRGYTLTPETIADLLHEVWAPHFDYDWLWGKAKRALDEHEYTNDPGCGPAGSPERYGAMPGTGQEIFGTAVQGIEPAPEMPRFKRASELRQMVFEPTRWIWDQRIVANKPNLLTGDGGAGKTTLAENLAVACAAGVPCLGAATMQSNVVLLLGEDGYQRIDANLDAIRQHYGLDPAVLDRIHVFSGEDESLPQGQPWLVQINDEGTRIEDSPFMREIIVPLLQSLAGPVLFVVDPLIQFAVFNQLADRAVGALARTWFKEVCRIADVTCLVNDHPSTSGMEKGRHYAGSKEMRNAFPNFSTLIAGEWSGGLARQKKLTLKGMRNRYGVEQTVEFYRNSNDGAVLKMQALPGQSPADHAARVYGYVIERHQRGQFTSRTDQGAHGPYHIGRDLGMDAKDARLAVEACLSAGTLVYVHASGDGRNRVPAHLAPGPNSPAKADPEEY